MNKAKSNNKMIIFLLGGVFFGCVMIGSMFYIHANTIKENIYEYSQINRENMHPLDSIRFRFL